MRYNLTVLVLASLLGVLGCGDKKPEHKPTAMTRSVQKPKTILKESCPKDVVEPIPVLRVLHFNEFSDISCGAENDEDKGPGKSCDKRAIDRYRRLIQETKKELDYQMQVGRVGEYAFNWPVCWSDKCKALQKQARAAVLKAANGILVTPEGIADLLGPRDFATLTQYYYVERWGKAFGDDSGLVLLQDKIWNEKFMSSWQYEQQLNRIRSTCEFRNLMKKMQGLDCSPNSNMGTSVVLQTNHGRLE